jgi:hypothetical protein
VTSTALALTAANDKAALVFTVPVSGNITHIRWRCGTVTAGQDVRVSLQTVDAATGYPTGTMYKGSNYSAAVTPVTDTTFETALGTQATSAVAGDTVAAVIQWQDDGSPGTSVGVTVASLTGHIPYCAQMTGGAAWAMSNTLPIGGLRYTSTYYGMSTFPDPLATLALDSDGAVAEAGNTFTLPFSARCIGMWALVDADQNLALTLYGVANATLVSATLDKDIRPSTSGGPAAVYCAPVTLLPNVAYKACIAATSTTACNTYEFDCAANADLGLSAGGTGITKVWRDPTEYGKGAAGTFTADTGNQVLVGPILDQVDVVAGGMWAG